MWKPKTKRGQILAILAILAMLITIVTAGTTVYWHKAINQPIHVTGIDAALLQPGSNAHQLKTNATQLTDGKICFTIYSENYAVIWLNLTMTSNCPGLAFGTITGQYYHCGINPSSGIGYYDPYGSSFAITPGTMQVIDKVHCMWGASNDGYELEITITWVLEKCTTFGDFTAVILFQAGFNAA